MPRAAVDKLGAALIAVIRTPEVRARLSAAGAEVMTSTPQEIQQFLVSERQRWSGVISRAGKQLEGTA
jgi:tripartite-type tricarboxylate transporter receptor subunit TctC